MEVSSCLEIMNIKNNDEFESKEEYSEIFRIDRKIENMERKFKIILRQKI